MAKEGKKTPRGVLQLQSWEEIRKVPLCQSSPRQNIPAEMSQRRACTVKECYASEC